MIKTILLIVNFILVAVLGAIVFTHESEKKAYIINQEVFDGFEGKLALEKELSALKTAHKQWLDSVNLEIVEKGNRSIIQLYQQQAAAFVSEEERLSGKFTADIWQLINQYTGEYGKKNGYDFIYGATGNGSLMYAGESNNITKELILFINDRYKAEASY